MNFCFCAAKIFVNHVLKTNGQVSLLTSTVNFVRSGTSASLKMIETRLACSTQALVLPGVEREMRMP